MVDVKKLYLKNSLTIKRCPLIFLVGKQIFMSVKMMWLFDSPFYKNKKNMICFLICISMIHKNNHVLVILT